MKKKVFELLYDEEEKKFEILSEANPFAGLDPNNMESVAQMDRHIEKIVGTLLEKKDSDINKIIRILTLAEICSDLQPYENIEQLWSFMMFNYLPEHERRFRKMKEQFGMRVKVSEPMTYVNPVLGNLFDSKLS